MSDWVPCPVCGALDDTEGGPCNSCGIWFATCWGIHDGGLPAHFTFDGSSVVLREDESCPVCVP